MTDLKKPIHRTSTARRRERGRERGIICSLLPPAYVGLRLAGTRATFLLDIEVAYELAIHQRLRDVERLAKRIQKSERIRSTTARKNARKQIDAEVAAVLASARKAAKKKKAGDGSHQAGA